MDTNATLLPADQIKTDIVESYRNCLSTYREQTEEVFYSGLLRGFRMDQKLVVEGNQENDAIIDMQDNRASVIATCPKSGKLTIYHTFQSVYYLPIANTPFEVRTGSKPKSSGYGYTPGEIVKAGTIGPDGKATVDGLEPGKRYQIIFYPDVTDGDLKGLFSSYDTVINTNVGWLNAQWATFKPEWDYWLSLSEGEQRLLLVASRAEGVVKGIGAILEGMWEVLKGVWDALKGLLSFLLDPIGKTFSLAKSMMDFDLSQIPELLKKANTSISNGLAILQDEAYLFLFGAAFIAWAKMIPPQTLATLSGELLIGIVFDVVIGVVLTGGIGLAVKYGGKTVKTGAKLADNLNGIRKAPDEDTIIAAVADLLGNAKALMKPHLAISNKIHGNTLAPLDSGYSGDTQYKKPQSIAAQQPLLSTSQKNVAPEALSGKQEDFIPSDEPSTSITNEGQPHTTLMESKLTDSESTPSTNDNGDVAKSDSKTTKKSEPISMVTGEELLTLHDASLKGMMAFDWHRYYRTSAVDQEGVLGYGWVHSLEHRLWVADGQVYWRDHESRTNQFSVPTASKPAIVNYNAGTAIYLGPSPTPSEQAQGVIAEYILCQPSQPFYHFRIVRSADSTEGSTGYLVALSDAYNNRLAVRYDNHSRISTLETEHNTALRFSYQKVATRTGLKKHPRDRLASVEFESRVDYFSDPSRTTLMRYHYNDVGQLTIVENAAGEREYYGYDADHVLTSRQFGGGLKIQWQWQGKGKQVKALACNSKAPAFRAQFQWKPESGKSVARLDDATGITYFHDEHANLVKQVAADGTTTLYEYNDDGLLLREEDQDGIGKSYHYDNNGNVSTLIDKDSTVTHFDYHKGYLRKVERGDQRWLYQRNDQGDIIAKTDPSGALTQYRYTEQGKLKEIRYPDGGLHQLEWNHSGELVAERLPTGDHRTYCYDEYHRLITLKAENGAITQYEYDALDRVICLRDSGNHTQHYRYNALDKVTHYTDELGRTTQYLYDVDTGLLREQHNPDGTKLRYQYDEQRGLITDVENESGEHYLLKYDVNGRVIQEIDFAGRNTQYSLNAQGYLIAKKEIGSAAFDSPELITEFDRDVMGRITQKRLADGRVIDYQYNEQGKLLSVDDGERPLFFEYDELGQLTVEHQGYATLRYGYDSQGRLTKMKLPDGNRLRYHYQVGSLLNGIDLNGEPLTRHGYQHGQEISRRQGQAKSHYTYDEQGRLTQQQLTFGNSQHANARVHHGSDYSKVLQQRDYRYNVTGLLAEITDSQKGKLWYDYDPLDRLTAVRGAVEERFEHDASGNVRGMHSQDEAHSQDRHASSEVKGNRLTVQGDRKFAYDAFGNVATEYRGKGHKLVTHYEYDCQHRLSKVHLPNGTIAQYFYDPFGRRYKKQVNGIETLFFWQGERLIAEEVAGQAYRSFIYELGTFRPLAQLEGEGQQAECYYYQLDHLGTPQELFHANGNLAWMAQYRAYGNVKRKVVHMVDTPLRFQGQYFDEETGLHYNRHRYYNPNTGCFLTPDPIKLSGGINNYQYVLNPINWVDPLGLSAETGCKQTPTTAEQDQELQGQRDEGIVPPKSLMDNIIDEANLVAAAGGEITDTQRSILRQNLPVVQRRNPFQNRFMRSEFEKNQRLLMASWSEATGRSWPMREINGVMKPATPHHIIPLESGGSNKWWNLMPTFGRLPNHSLPGIPGPHARDGVLRETIQRGPKALPGGTITDLRGEK
ncbi:DUF6531 domain-containing protein [Photobacterium japonica]|uniref:RHS repeat-associated core domain-containing protein n=1 Tax=Photobacterium japonica TaxID=2910235 RepID=UPI003D09EFA0